MKGYWALRRSARKMHGDMVLTRKQLTALTYQWMVGRRFLRWLETADARELARTGRRADAQASRIRRAGCTKSTHT